MKNLFILTFLLIASTAFAQKPGPLVKKSGPVRSASELPKLKKPASAGVAQARLIQGEVNYQSMPSFVKPVAMPEGLKIDYSENGLPIQISGLLPKTAQLPLQDQVYAYLEACSKVMKTRMPKDEWIITEIRGDAMGNQHVRMAQVLQNVPVWGSEIVLHARVNGQIDLMNGRYFATPNLASVTPAVAAETALFSVEQMLAAKSAWVNIPEGQLHLIDGPQATEKLVIYQPNERGEGERLAWHFKVYPNVMARYEVFVDAQTGEILNTLNTLCNLNHNHSAHKDCAHDAANSAPAVPPTTATAQDLGGVNRTINTFQIGSQYYMIDASKPMFSSSQSSMPDDPAGAIWTITGNNTSPETDNFNVTQVLSSNNNWSGNPKAVSAQYNGGVAYNYFKNTHNRNSINGQGGTIISIINVSESNGAGMDNAFWNGQAMFYGNGNDLFTPLAEALDVAGHEMSHGVIEKTANLTYQGESGALNESFADIFGAMMDLGDWKIGEDIIQPGAIPSGCLRNMSNPNNGGTSLSQFYWQPDNTDDQYTGTQDNGGVHINSGITNYAYYLFATSSGVGTATAEKVFYHALDQYLVASSKFIDLRAAVLQSITALGYGATVTNAANTAFNTVNIGSGGSSSGENYQVDIAPNPGSDLILYTTVAQDDIQFSNAGGAFIGTEPEPVLSRPNVIDNGTEVVWVGPDNKIYFMEVDWVNVTSEVSILDESQSWRNVCQSRDGSLLAAITTDLDNIIYVYSFNLQQWQTFELTSPTSSSGGNNTDNVQYADFLEFDLSGNYVLYDAYNSLNADVNYWDIGLIKVWGGNNFADGNITKLFNQLPANVSVGNPTFAKNSPYIIAFDYIDGNDDSYSVIGANIQTGTSGLIFDNDILGVPNFSRLDNQVLFNVPNGGSTSLGKRSVGSDKITGAGSATILEENGYWGVYFSDGARSLVDVQEIELESLLVAPNPTNGQSQLQLNSDRNSPAELQIFDFSGRLLHSETLQLNVGNNPIPVDLSAAPNGVYRVRVQTAYRVFGASVVRY